MPVLHAYPDPRSLHSTPCTDIPGPPCLPPLSDSAYIYPRSITQIPDKYSNYAVLIIVFSLVGVSFLLWLCWASWPRQKMKSLWKIMKGKKKQDKGIHSPAFYSSTSPHDRDESILIPEFVIVDLEIDEKEFGPMKTV